MSAIVDLHTERLFIGVPVPERTRLNLMRQVPADLPGRAAPPENWHFTLRFLGSTDASRRDRLIKTLASTDFGSAFDVEFDALGAFPNPRRARVLWVGVGNGHEKLERVARAAEEAARGSGFEAEPRKFTAHLTISRLKQSESVVEFLAKLHKVSAVMRVDEVILFRSELGRDHSRYSAVSAFRLR